MNIHKAREFWSANLHRYPAGDLAKANIPQSARDFLATVGMPTTTDPYFFLLEKDVKPMFLLGYVGFLKTTGIHLHPDGRCLLIEGSPTGGKIAGLVNSNVELLFQALTVVAICFSPLTRYPSDDPSTPLDQLEADLRAIDPAAFAHEANYSPDTLYSQRLP